MEVKTENGGTFDAAGNGTKGMSIAALATGITALVGGGLLSRMGSWGNNNGFNNGFGNGFCGQRFVTHEQFDQEKVVAALTAELEKEKAERYTDKAVINQAEKEALKDAKLAQDLLDIGVGVTRIDEQVKADREKAALREQIIDMKIKSVEDKLTGAIILESERRTCGDSNLYNYVNGTFVPGKLVMPMSNICPEAMPRYNSWEAPTAVASAATPAATN